MAVVQTWLQQPVLSPIPDSLLGGPHVHLAPLSSVFAAFSSLLVLFSQYLRSILSHLKEKKLLKTFSSALFSVFPLLYIIFPESPLDTSMSTSFLNMKPPHSGSTLQKLLLRSCFNVPDTKSNGCFLVLMVSESLGTWTLSRISSF